ncbi:uncharacterized protein LOC121854744 [Homarus americanus]|uniref:uncharacterized protein LOC121854744 n=1 Tax=Homarus americanus TaxID=6706 RepID=UPI001C44CBD5|nr:uncharacterized protein LOC121854744 [Homarus americanus]
MLTTHVVLLVVTSWSGWSLTEASGSGTSTARQYNVSVPSVDSLQYPCSVYNCVWVTKKMISKESYGKHGQYGGVIRSPRELNNNNEIGRGSSVITVDENGHLSHQNQFLTYSVPLQPTSHSLEYPIASSPLVDISTPSSAYSSLLSLRSSSITASPTATLNPDSSFYAKTSSSITFSPSFPYYPSVYPSSSSNWFIRRHQRSSSLSPYLSHFLSLNTERPSSSVVQPSLLDLSQRDYTTQSSPDTHQALKRTPFTYSDLPIDDDSAFIPSIDPVVSFLTESPLRSAVSSSPSVTSHPISVRSPPSESSHAPLSFPYAPLSSGVSYPFHLLNISSLSDIPHLLAFTSFPSQFPRLPTEQEEDQENFKTSETNAGSSEDHDPSPPTVTDQDLVARLAHLFRHIKTTQNTERVMMKESKTNISTDTLRGIHANDSQLPNPNSQGEANHTGYSSLLEGTEWLKFIKRYFTPRDTQMKTGGRPEEDMEEVDKQSNLASKLAKIKHDSGEEGDAQQDTLTFSQFDTMISKLTGKPLSQPPEQKYVDRIMRKSMMVEDSEDVRSARARDSWVAAEINMGSMGVLTLDIGDYLNKEIYLDVDINKSLHSKGNTAFSSTNQNRPGASEDEGNQTNITTGADDALNWMKVDILKRLGSDLSPGKVTNLFSPPDTTSSNTNARLREKSAPHSDDHSTPFDIHIRFSSPMKRNSLLKLSNILRMNSSIANGQDPRNPLIHLNIASGMEPQNTNASNNSPLSSLSQAYYYFHRPGQQGVADDRHQLDFPRGNESPNNHQDRGQAAVNKTQDDPINSTGLSKLIPVLDLISNNETMSALDTGNKVERFLETAISFWDSFMKQTESDSFDDLQRPPLPSTRLTAPGERYTDTQETNVNPLERFTKPLEKFLQPFIHQQRSRVSLQTTENRPTETSMNMNSSFSHPPGPQDFGSVSPYLLPPMNPSESQLLAWRISEMLADGGPQLYGERRNRQVIAGDRGVDDDGDKSDDDDGGDKSNDDDDGGKSSDDDVCDDIPGPSED